MYGICGMMCACVGGADGGGNVKADWVTCWGMTVDICGGGGEGGDA